MPLFRDGECPELRQWSEVSQILGFTACAVIANYVLSNLFHPFHFIESLGFHVKLIQDLGTIGAFTVVIGKPIPMTAFGQWLPIIVARWQKKPPFMQLIWAAIWFGILHATYGLHYVIQSIGVGWILASCFLFCRKENWFKAYRVTTIVHALHNAIIFALFYFFN